MTVKPHIKINLYAAKPKLAPVFKPMHVIAVTDTHGARAAKAGTDIQILFYRNFYIIVCTEHGFHPPSVIFVHGAVVGKLNIRLKRLCRKLKIFGAQKTCGV